MSGAGIGLVLAGRVQCARPVPFNSRRARGCLVRGADLHVWAGIGFGAGGMLAFSSRPRPTCKRRRIYMFDLGRVWRRIWWIWLGWGTVGPWRALLLCRVFMSVLSLATVWNVDPVLCLCLLCACASAVHYLIVHSVGLLWCVMHYQVSILVKEGRFVPTPRYAL